MSEFTSRKIGDMVAVGATDATGARLWIRTTIPGPHEIEVWSDRRDELSPTVRG